MSAANFSVSFIYDYAIIRTTVTVELKNDEYFDEDNDRAISLAVGLIRDTQGWPIDEWSPNDIEVEFAGAES